MSRALTPSRHDRHIAAVAVECGNPHWLRRSPVQCMRLRLWSRRHDGDKLDCRVPEWRRRGEPNPDKGRYEEPYRSQKEQP